MKRVPDVGDAWLDAGIVPFSTLNYLTDKEYWKAWFPADFICENMPGQYRGWSDQQGRGFGWQKKSQRQKLKARFL